MSQADFGVLLLAARGGDASAQAALAQTFRREIRASVAVHAWSQDTVQRLADEVWQAALHGSATMPVDPPEFLGWLQRLAGGIALRQLEAASRQSTVALDPLLRSLIAPALARLRAGDCSETAAAGLRERLERLPPTARKLIERRYVRGLGRAAIAAEQALDETTIAAAFCTARAAIDWDGAGIANDPFDRSTPLLIDGWLEAGLPSEARARLAAHLDSREHAASFERQVRVDLMLRALLGAGDVEPADGEAPPGTPRRTPSGHGLERQRPSTQGTRRPPPEAQRAVRTASTARGRSSGPNLPLLIGLGVAVVAVSIALMVGSGRKPVRIPAVQDGPLAAAPAAGPASSSTGPASPTTPTATAPTAAEPPGQITGALSISSPPNGSSYNADENIPIVVSVTERAGRARRVELILDGVRLGHRSSPPYAFVWQGGSPGPHRLEARLTDGEGVIHRSHPVQVTISKGTDRPPRVTLQSPTDGATTNPGTVRLQADAQDPNGRVVKVEFFVDDARIGERTSEPFRLDWTATRPGAYMIRAEAVDDQGNVSRDTARLMVSIPGATLTMTTEAAPTMVDVAAEGTLDWVAVVPEERFGLVRRAGRPPLISWEAMGDVLNKHFNAPTRFAWRGGEPAAESGGSTHGVHLRRLGCGFRITVRADTHPRKLRLHLGGYHGRAKMTASLTDLSAGPVVDIGIDNAENKGHVHTIDYRAAGPGQVLIVKYQLEEAYNGDGEANVAFHAATLSGPDPLAPGGVASWPFSGRPAPIPGRFEAEHYDLGGEGFSYHDTGDWGDGPRGDGVEIENAASGAAVSFVRPGEWLAYTVDVAKAGTYRVALVASQSSAGATVHLEAGGVDVSGPIPVPQTHDWGRYVPVEKGGVRLAAGRQILRLVADKAGPGQDHVGNFDALSFVAE